MSFPGGLIADITHWTAVPDGYGGNTFGTPTVLKGRWAQKAEMFLSAVGRELVSKSVVHLDTDVEEGDYLFNGNSSVVDPTTIDAHIVRGFSKIPDLRNLTSVRKALL